jgi:4a-hydroxytetrahydrobiopterin dehydratase
MPPKLEPVALAEQLAGLPAWQVDAQRGAVSREYVLRDFAQAFTFMTRVALACEKRDHHPEWFNVYHRVRITWTTHDAGGLTLNDIEMARLCDEVFSVMSQAPAA